MASQKKRIGLREIASRAQCSVGTVSMALNDRPELADATKKRIQGIAQELGYVMDRVAKSLSLGRSGVIGVVMPFSIDPYYAAILDSLDVESEKQGYQLQIQFHRWSTDAEERAMRKLIESRVDGILLYPARARYGGTSFHEWLARTKTPIVSLSNTGGDLPFLVGQLSKDHAWEAILTGEELRKLGHSRIDILFPRAKANEEDPRYQGLLEYGVAHGLDVRIFQKKSFREDETTPFFQAHGFGVDDYERLVRDFVGEYLESPDRGTAMVTCNHPTAWYLMMELHKRGARLPEDLSIISSGIRGGGNSGFLPLSAIEYDAGEIARYALGCIGRWLDEGQASSPVKIRPGFFARSSTLPFALSRSADPVEVPR